MDDLHAIIINILSSILWLPLGALLAYIVFYFQVRHPRRRLWHLHDPGNLVICAANSTTTDTGVYQRPATGIGQVRAIALAIESLSHAYRKNLAIRNILLSTDHVQERIENDLLIVGGPKNNRVAEKFLDLLADEQPAIQIGTVITWRKTRLAGRWMNDAAVTTYDGQAIEQQVVKDYGLIIRCQNPFTSRNRTAILFSGSHTYGTVAAAKYFTDDMQRQIGTLLRNGKKNCALLVSAQIIDGYPTKMRLEHSYTW
jgi:hypothetical protein